MVESRTTVFAGLVAGEWLSFHPVADAPNESAGRRR
jgi:hypothetical protein